MEVLNITDATQITTGHRHSCALRQTGTITCWGYNEDGQLGDGTTSDSSVPVEVLNITDATQITTGSAHSCALRQTGTITCWGWNEDGQLGDGTTSDSSVPVEVLNITDATQITTGSHHSCALRQTGTITCWGWNEYGQLGDGTYSSSSVPVEVLNITDATQITAGGEHSCALRQTGTITCWGYNEYGQLGDGTTSYYSSVPVEVLNITDATQITAGRWHSCALRQTGTITCWGYNEYGQLGDGTTSYYSSVPVEVLNITDATQITAGRWHSCALRQTGTITCWGDNEDGQLGDGTTSDSRVPVEVLNITDATQITAGHRHSCALRQTGTITCWGNNWDGQLGDGTTSDYSSVPVEVLNITDATQITTGHEHSCALRQTGTITCWGYNGRGRLGDGTTSDYSSVPVEVLNITDATQITTGGAHSCALRQTGTITCWGWNEYGQLGDGTTSDSRVPVEVLNITDATQITAGHRHSCALRQTGTITCWGYNGSGQLGDGTTSDYSSVPVEVLNITDATQITTGGAHSCALRQTGTITCWGYNGSGRLGDGTTSDYSSVPVEVLNITDATQIITGGEHSCALRQTGTITCWGDNGSGQLGDGTTSSSLVPVEVLNITDATQITTGGAHSCALRQTGTITCWGRNRFGQLGDGAFLPRDVVGFGG